MAAFMRPFISPSIHHGNRELVERLRWVIGLRWSVVLALLLVTLFMGMRGNLETGYSRENSLAHMGLAMLVLAYTFFFLFASRQPDFGQSGLTKLIRYGQVPVDLLVVT